MNHHHNHIRRKDEETVAQRLLLSASLHSAKYGQNTLVKASVVAVSTYQAVPIMISTSRLCILSLFLQLATSFSPIHSLYGHRRTAVLAAVSDESFMASLQSRMEEVNDRETKLPLVVLDAMLPRQVLKIRVNNPVFMDLVKTRVENETPWFGMLGMARISTGERIHLRDGVRVDIVGKPQVDDESSLLIQLRGAQLFRVEGEVDNAPQGWTEGRVAFKEEVEEEENEPSIIGKAKELSSMADEWISLARTHERQEGQIDQLLKDLGEIPPPENASDRAMWIGALINPIPALGVALEIRPALLTARTTEERLNVAYDGMKRSIKHMNGSELLS